MWNYHKVGSFTMKNIKVLSVKCGLLVFDMGLTRKLNMKISLVQTLLSKWDFTDGYILNRLVYNNITIIYLFLYKIFIYYLYFFFLVNILPRTNSFVEIDTKQNIFIYIHINLPGDACGYFLRT